MPELPTTQRAYTLRLRGMSKDDHFWRDWLWRTHLAVNQSARVFGDWLLTLRGGLDHGLAHEPSATDEDIKQEWDRLKKAAKEKSGDKPTREEAVHSLEEQRQARIRDRRIVLALAWLSVESKLGAPERFLVERDTTGHQQPVEALRRILKSRGLGRDDNEEWVEQCRETLEAKIREGEHISDPAVWINRSAAFDAAVKHLGKSLTRDEVWDLFERFFGSQAAYFEMPRGEDSERSDEAAAQEKAKDLVIKAGGWLSNRFGSGTGSDFTAIAAGYEAFAKWSRSVAKKGAASASAIAKSLAAALGQDELPDRLAATPGPSNKVQTAYQRIAEALRKDRVPQEDFVQLAEWSDEQAAEKHGKSGNKGPRPWATAMLHEVEKACGFTYAPTDETGAARHWEFSVILDHAARRVCMAHSWVKRAEVTRRGFVKSLRRMNRVPAKAKAWLDDFCERRGGQTGAVEGYRIRPGAVEGWKELVVAWSRKNCRTEEDRITAARELQASDEIEKFGDIQLFEALAAENEESDARCVWHDDNAEPSAEPLLDYVAATNAAAKMREYKVPAYRHPDELRHPVFCDFGESRWSISFAVHRAASEIEAAQKAVSRAVQLSQKATQKTDKANSDEKRQVAQADLEDAQRKHAEARNYLTWLQSPNGLRIKLWDGSTVEDKNLTWASKRLKHDLDLRAGTQAAGSSNDQTTQSKTISNNPVEVSRGDRLGRAVANVKADQPIEIDGLFGLKEWNGRLQAPRAELDAIADVRDKLKAKNLSRAERDRRAERMLGRLHWFVTFSARLTPRGPWCEFAEENPDLGLRLDPTFWPHADENKQRQGRGRLMLGRLPGLRILSVDLGHRYAAACAVWETVTADALRKACKAAGIASPGASDLFVFVPRADHGYTLFRRIGPDKLPNDSKHPAPWARLDRQFLIKLQGEDQPARWANDDERRFVEKLEKELGYERSDADQRHGSGWRVDEIMSNAVRISRLALRRHGDYARIAEGLIAKERQGMGKNATEKLKGPKLVEHLQDVLVRWHTLATSSRWQDKFSALAWSKHIGPLLQGAALPKVADDMTGSQRKAIQKKVREGLARVAEELACRDRMKMHVEWATQWRKADPGWKQRLKRLREWIAPRGKKSDKTIRHVGGLSLKRIATFKEFSQLQKAFFTRLTLTEDGKLEKETAGLGFGQRLLDQLDAMRENRVKQLASRIAEAALGIGIERPRAQTGRQLKRPRERLDQTPGDESQRRRFAPCHAVVIENLTRYRPDELQTRRENRQLMSWSSSRVKKFLAEACQLHGLHLREVSPGYTSRQDFRTGAPGVRCVDVTVAEFTKRFGRELGRAADATRPDALQRYLLDLRAKHFQQTSQDSLSPRKGHEKIVLRMPRRGGEIFVPAEDVLRPGDQKRTGWTGVQADLNAAANIGLKALLDPDWPGAWWYVPTVAKDGFRVPQPDRTKGCAALEHWQLGRVKDGYGKAGSVEVIDDPNAEKLAKKKPKIGRSKEVVNLWRDVSTAQLSAQTWKVYAAYEALTRWRVIQILRRAAGLPKDFRSAAE